MNALRLSILFFLVIFSGRAAADWQPVFQYGQFEGETLFNGSLSRSFAPQSISSPGYPYGSMANLNRATDTAYLDFQAALNARVADAIASEGPSAAFGSGRISGPLSISWGNPDSSGWRDVQVSVQQYSFNFTAWGSRNGWQLSCQVFVDAPNVRISFRYNKDQVAAQNPSITSGTISHSVHCNVTGFSWLEVIGRIFVKWLIPGPNDILRYASVGDKLFKVVSAAAAVDSSGGGTQPAYANPLASSMTIVPYYYPTLVAGYVYPWNLGNQPITTNFFSANFGTSVGQYGFRARRVEVWDYVWWSGAGCQSCIEP